MNRTVMADTLDRVAIQPVDGPPSRAVIVAAGDILRYRADIARRAADRIKPDLLREMQDAIDAGDPASKILLSLRTRMGVGGNQDLLNDVADYLGAERIPLTVPPKPTPSEAATGAMRVLTRLHSLMMARELALYQGIERILAEAGCTEDYVLACQAADLLFGGALGRCNLKGEDMMAVSAARDVAREATRV